MRGQVSWFFLVTLIALMIILPTAANAIQPFASAPNAGFDLTPLQAIGQITAGDGHTCALTTAGGVLCWGRNDYGQLGDNTTTAHNLPVDVFGLSSGIKAVVAGAYHTCALTDAGGVKCWGNNEFGQLGDGTAVSRPYPRGSTGVEQWRAGTGAWRSPHLRPVDRQYKMLGRQQPGSTGRHHANAAQHAGGGQQLV